MRMGIGLAAVGRPAYINTGRDADFGRHREVDQLRARTAAVLDAAYAGGIRYIDTARSYGYAEQFLRDWLDTHPEVDDVVIGSKWGYRYVGGWRTDVDVHEVKDHSPAAFAEQIAQSRTILGDRIGIYHIHSATPETGVLDNRAVLAALAELRETGVVVGLSVSGPFQAETVRHAVRIHVDGTPLFTSVQATWNPLEPSAGAALAEAADRGARVIVKEGLANGRLVRGRQGRDPEARRVLSIAQRLQVPIDQLALAAALAQPWAWRVLSGAATADQVISNLEACSLTVDGDTLTELAAVAVPPEQYWRQRAERAWS